MGSKGRMAPPQPRPRYPQSGDRFGPPPGRSYEMLGPPEVMEQKLATQHVEMQRLSTENHRLAGTHGSLRQELAASQHEIQMINGQIAAVKSDADQQMRAMTEGIAKMEAELKAAEPLRSDLQKAHSEAQKLIASRQELLSKVQLLSTDLQRAHLDVQQIPALMSEIDALRQDYQLCRAKYDYEKKLYSDHLESLQAMEKNYMNMAREVEKLRGELMNPAYADRRPAAPYGGVQGSNENEASGYPVTQNGNEDSYAAIQGRATLPLPPPPPPPPPPPAGPTAPVAPGTSAYGGAQSGAAAAGPTTYDLMQQVHGGYDPQFQRGGGSNYEAQRAGYDPQRAQQGFEVQRGGPGYDPSRPGAHATYGSATPPQPARAGNNNPAARR